MNTFNISLMKKQMENNQMNNLFPAFSRHLGKKDDEEDDEEPENNFLSGNHYIC